MWSTAVFGVGQICNRIMNWNHSSYANIRLAPNKRKSALIRIIISVSRVQSCRRYWCHVIRNMRRDIRCCSSIKCLSQVCHTMLATPIVASIRTALAIATHRWAVPVRLTPIRIHHMTVWPVHRRLPIVPPRMVIRIIPMMAHKCSMHKWGIWHRLAIRSQHFGHPLHTMSSIVGWVRSSIATIIRLLLMALRIHRTTLIAAVWASWAMWIATVP